MSIPFPEMQQQRRCQVNLAVTLVRVFMQMMTKKLSLSHKTVGKITMVTTEINYCRRNMNCIKPKVKTILPGSARHGFKPLDSWTICGRLRTLGTASETLGTTL